MKKSLTQFIHHWSWMILVIFLLVGLVYPIVGILATLCMVAPVVVGFFKGRYWCGNFCPRGSLNDRLLSKVSRKKPLPGFMRTDAFKVAFLILIMTGFVLQITWAWGDIRAVGAVFVRMILITTAVDVIFGGYYQHRAWCTICPMGYMACCAAQVAHVKKPNGHIVVTSACVGCKLCSKACPVGIQIHESQKEGAVKHADCLKCQKCVKKCPRNALVA